jgi:hypothetical protein
MSPKYTITSIMVEKRLRTLERFKEKNKFSWDEIAEDFNLHKRTILRWKKNRKMSEISYRLLGSLLNNAYTAIFCKRGAAYQQDELRDFKDF